MACHCPSTMSDFSLNRGFPLANNSTSPRHSTPRKLCTIVDTEADTMCLDELFHSTCKYANEVNSRISDRRENEKRAMGDNLTQLEKDLLYTEVTTKATDYYRGLVQDKLSTRRDILEKTQQDMADSFNHLFSAVRQVENSEAYSGMYKELQNLRALVKVLEVAAERYGVSNSESRFLGDLEKVVRCIECMHGQHVNALCEISKLRSSNQSSWEENPRNPSEDSTHHSLYHEEKTIYIPCDDQQPPAPPSDQTPPCPPCGDQPKCDKNRDWKPMSHPPAHRRFEAGRCAVRQPPIANEHLCPPRTTNCNPLEARANCAPCDPHANCAPCEINCADACQTVQCTTTDTCQCAATLQTCGCAPQNAKMRQSCDPCDQHGCNCRQANDSCNPCNPCGNCVPRQPFQCQQPTQCNNACMQCQSCQCAPKGYQQLQHVCHCRPPDGTATPDLSQTSCEDVGGCSCPAKEEVCQPCLAQPKRRKKGSCAKKQKVGCEGETCKKTQRCRKRCAAAKASSTACSESAAECVVVYSCGSAQCVKEGAKVGCETGSAFCPIVHQDACLQTVEREDNALPCFACDESPAFDQSPCVRELLNNRDSTQCRDIPISPRNTNTECPVVPVPTCLQLMTDEEMSRAAAARRKEKMLQIGVALITLALLTILAIRVWAWMKTTPASEDIVCKTCSPIMDEENRFISTLGDESWSFWDVLGLGFLFEN